MSRVSAFLAKEMTWLKRVLTMSDADKGRDLAGYMPHVFDDWAGATGHYEFDEDDPEEVAEAEELAMLEDYERAEKILEDDPTAAAFYGYASQHRDVHYDPYSPPHIHMDYRGIVKRDWLIHFTDDAHAIADNGFQYGVDDINKLGLSTHFKERKARGGYNFAYRLNDFVKYGKSGYRGADWKYGKEAVVFQASGILVYHYGDDEPQVIFDGKTAKNIIPLTSWDGDWSVESVKTEEPLFTSDDLDKVVRWVVNNFRQYRKPLMGSSDGIGKQVAEIENLDQAKEMAVNFAKCVAHTEASVKAAVHAISGAMGALSPRPRR